MAAKLKHPAPDSFIVSPLTNSTGSLVKGGIPFAYGGGFVILQNDLAIGATDGVGHTNVVVNLAALSTDTPADGAKMYWDSTNARLTTTAAGNTLIGHARGAKASGVATMDIFVPSPPGV